MYPTVPRRHVDTLAAGGKPWYVLPHHVLVTVTDSPKGQRGSSPHIVSRNSFQNAPILPPISAWFSSHQRTDRVRVVGNSLIKMCCACGISHIICVCLPPLASLLLSASGDWRLCRRTDRGVPPAILFANLKEARGANTGMDSRRHSKSS